MLVFFVFDYGDTVNIAANALAEYGAATVITREIDRVFDAAAGTMSGGTTLTINGKGLMTQFIAREIDGTNIKLGDVKIMFQAGVGAPLIGDQLRFSGVTYRVMEPNPFSPAGVDLFYDIQCRR